MYGWYDAMRCAVQLSGSFPFRPSLFFAFLFFFLFEKKKTYRIKNENDLALCRWEAPSIPVLAQFMREISTGKSAEELDVSFVEVDEDTMYCDIEAVGGEPTGITGAIDNTIDTTRTALSAFDLRFKISETLRNVTGIKKSDEQVTHINSMFSLLFFKLA